MNSNWQIKKLGEVCKITYGKGLSTKELKQSGFPVFGANGIIGFNDVYLYKEPQVLISCRGAYSGKINFSPPLCYVTNNSLVLEINEEQDLDKTFLYYILQTVNKTKLVTGTAQPQVTINNAVELEFSLPKIQTQQAIVSKIEELFSELEKGIEDLKTAQLQLKTYRQSVLKCAFEGKFTNKNLKEGELPEEWELKTLGEVLKVSSGKGIKINQLKGGDYSVYGGNGLNGYHTEYFIEDPVLIIGRVGVKCGVTHITKSKSWVSDNALIVSPIVSDFDAKFFKLRLEFENLNKLSVSTAQPVISGNSIYSVSLSLPKKEEQHLIVQEIESRLSVADKMEESISQSLQQAEALRQSILKKAFSGKLV